MAKTSLVISTVDHMTTMTLNRPEKRNALHAEIIREMIHGLNGLAKDPTSAILCINASGDHFCAGADIQSMQTIADHSFEDNLKDAGLLADLLYQLYTYPKPTMVLVQGAAMGGALGMIAACDMAIAAENATFCFSEVKLGIAPSVISPYVITAIGERAAHYYFLTAERFGAEVAERIGLIHRRVALEALPEFGMTFARTLLNHGPHALMAVKQLIRQVAKEKITKKVRDETALQLAKLRTTAEAKEGLSAFLEKRSPKWNR